MTVDKKSEAARLPDGPETVAKTLIRSALKGALATLDSKGWGPFASLVLVATTQAGAPVFLLSGLALHTRNILADRRASLLIDGTDAAGDPMAGARVSVSGTVAATLDQSARQRFLAHHPGAAVYADFPDFAFYTMTIERAHLVQGFGRIIDIHGQDLLDPGSA